MVDYDFAVVAAPLNLVNGAELVLGVVIDIYGGTDLVFVALVLCRNVDAGRVGNHIDYDGVGAGIAEVVGHLDCYLVGADLAESEVSFFCCCGAGVAGRKVAAAVPLQGKGFALVSFVCENLEMQRVVDTYGVFKTGFGKDDGGVVA